jgi:hypothetical protein
MGKRGVYEYDYYVDHTDDVDRKHCLNAMNEAVEMIEGFCSRANNVKGIMSSKQIGMSYKGLNLIMKEDEASIIDQRRLYKKLTTGCSLGYRCVINTIFQIFIRHIFRIF